MNITNQFVVLVRDVPTSETANRPLVNAFLRFCEDCKELTPHYRYETYCQCAVCWTETYKVQTQNGEQGQALVEVALWIAVVVVVLLVTLKDSPW